jgi:hypothetical protein
MTTALERAHRAASDAAQALERAQHAESEAARERERAQRAETEMIEARERAELAENEMHQAQAQARRAEAELAWAHERAQHAEAEAAHERERGARAEAATQDLSDLTERLTAQLASTNEALELARANGRQPAGEPSANGNAADGLQASGEDTLRWGAHAQLAFASILSGASEWRTGLKDAVKVLGGEGKWDAVCAWVPDSRIPVLRCGAMWTASPHGMGRFETATWQQPQALGRTELGRAFSASEVRWMTNVANADDDRLLAAAREGIRSAMLVPVRDGTSTVAILELMTAGVSVPDSELLVAIEAVGLQLGHFWHLLQVGAEPHWRMGRM